MPALVAVGVLVAVSIYGLMREPDAATLNNVAFAAVHVSILMTGAGRPCGRRGPGPPRSRTSAKRRREVGNGRRGCVTARRLARRVPVRRRRRRSAARSGTCPRRAVLPEPVRRRRRTRRTARSRWRHGRRGPGIRDADRRGIGDRRRFDKIWDWTRSHLRRPDGLLCSAAAGGRVVGYPSRRRTPGPRRGPCAARGRLCSRPPGCRANRRRARRAVLAHETARRGSQLIVAAGPWAIGQPVTSTRATSSRDPAGPGGRVRHRAPRGPPTTGGAVARLSTPLPPGTGRGGAASGNASRGTPGQRCRPSTDRRRTLMPGMARTRTRPAQDRRGGVAGVPRPAADAIVLERHLDGSPAGGTAHAAGTGRGGRQRRGPPGDRQDVSRLLDAAAVQDARSPTYYASAWVALGRRLLTTNRLAGDCS